MRICGLQKLTLLDFPEHTACTLFTGGCDLRCPFCHNGPLVLAPEEQPTIPEEELFRFLQRRRGLLDGVCVSGGEPTLQPGLERFLLRVRELGFAVKLDTNGGRPEILARLLEKGLVDYVAMDVKSALGRYGAACGLPDYDTAPVEESARLLGSSGVDHEFRTTLVRELHSLEDMDGIGRWLAGAPRYFLQQFRESEGVIQRGFTAFDRWEMEEMRNRLARWIPAVCLRGVAE